ncbi:helicase-related protein, partial [Roseovarius sp.]|uniref:helicase-related protein n=1 Tax=Roseovarius sp. TaxID=1486281 RepID=UPI0035672A88
LFSKVERQLVHVYRELMGELINRSLPLVIVDEAHNWKNGPSSGSNGYDGFTSLIACRARRALLLTATPFQLRPSEMLEILKVGDHLATCPTEGESHKRRARLKEHREQVIQPLLVHAARASRRFAKAWSKLPPTTTRHMIQTAWQSTPMAHARIQLREAAERRGVVKRDELEQIIDTALTDEDPEVRQLLREALRVFAYNTDLSFELGVVVIRHRRQTEHRMFRVGMEYQAEVNNVRERPDRHVLHAAPGVDVRGEGELPHFVLMRCVSEMKGGKGRSSLGSALTGCYSTLVDSAEGQSVKTQLAATEAGKVYLDLLMSMVNRQQDTKHPKVREVVDTAVQNWKSGEKMLIFCFRTNTAKRLHEIMEHRIRKELDRRRNRCMGGPESLKTLRTRLTGRDRDLVVLGLDRVLWSFVWTNEISKWSNRQIVPDDLVLMDRELPRLAELGLRFGVDLIAERIDRVFLNRATEHVLARRLIRELQPKGPLKRMLTDIAREDWISGPYGLSPREEDDESGTEAAQFDERGVHSLYEERAEANAADIDRVAHRLAERRKGAAGKVPVLDVYGRGPNLWLGDDPVQQWRQSQKHRESPVGKTLQAMHGHIFTLMSSDEAFWESRRMAFQAIRRAVLRESVLLRLLPDKKERDEASWGELIVKAFFTPLPRQREGMADRISVFLEDLMAASGSLSDPSSARFALYDATRLRDQQFVALVYGDSDQQSRERVFSGFNTPLLPEVLICTSIGQEGIDLHRHCRHVVHFDLAWNPAVLEQRTGRADRIGSKTFRERAFSRGHSDSFLDIGVPYLAGTYDERMYEELRLRAQTFEVLTGGDLVADDAAGVDNQKRSEGQEAGLRLVPLPDDMVDEMRVSLHVWTEDK